MLTHSRAYIDVEKILDRVATDDLQSEDHVAAFEAAFARYIGAPACIATNQARAALFIGLKALQLPENAEVILQSFTYRGVADAIIEAGARPLLVDNAKSDLNADIQAIRDACTENTRVILATNLFGNPTNIEEIMAIAREKGLYVIEDCAQCLKARYSGRTVGTFGDMAIVSFNNDKHITTGEGGMLAINRTELIGRVQAIASGYKRQSIFGEKCYVYGMLMMHLAAQKQYFEPWWDAYFGQNYCIHNPAFFKQIDELIQQRPDKADLEREMGPHISKEKMKFHRNILAKILMGIYKKTRDRVVQIPLATIETEQLLMGPIRSIVGLTGLESLDAVNAVRNANARRYREALEGTSYTLPEDNPKKDPVYLRYCVLNNSTIPVDQITQRARARGLNIGNFQWAQPIHRAEPYRTVIPHKQEDLTTSAFIADTIINLPVHYYVALQDIENVVDCLKEAETGCAR